MVAETLAVRETRSEGKGGTFRKYAWSIALPIKKGVRFSSNAFRVLVGHEGIEPSTS